jgi:hypothetical protein
MNKLSKEESNYNGQIDIRRGLFDVHLCLRLRLRHWLGDSFNFC